MEKCHSEGHNFEPLKEVQCLKKKKSLQNIACCCNVILVYYISVVYIMPECHTFSSHYAGLSHVFNMPKQCPLSHILSLTIPIYLLQNVGMSWWLGDTVSRNLNNTVHVSSSPSRGVYTCHDSVMLLLGHNSRDAGWHGQIVGFWLGRSAALPRWMMGWQTMCEAGWTWCCVSVSRGRGRRPVTPFSPYFLVDAAVTHKWRKSCWCIWNMIL